MSRSKYINTFNTTADYENYIESAVPEFPNVGYDKQAGKVKIMRTSPNNHLFYGELNDNTISPAFCLINNYNIVKTYNLTVDQINNTYYIDDWETLPTFNAFNEYSFFNGLKNKVTSLKKFYMDTSSVTNMNNMFKECSSLTSVSLSGLDTSSVTNISGMFRNCTSLTLLDLTDCDFTNVTTQTNAFYQCMSLTDVYITVEGTLMKITNNLSSQGTNYVPASATIHYDNGSEVIDYKWQNNAWTPQS